MSPARAEATARSTAPAPARRPARPRPTAVPESPAPRRGLGRVTSVARSLRQGNQLGRMATLAAVALFASVFGIVVFQTLIVQGQARLDAISAKAAVQDARGKDLRQQVAELESPTRIVAAARNQLGMISPAEVGYLHPAADDDAKAAYVAAPATTPTTKAPAPAKTTPTTKAPTTGKATTPTTTVPKKTTTTTTPAKKTTTPTTSAPK